MIGYYHWVQGIGQVLVAGPLANWIVGARRGWHGGRAHLARRGLHSIGIPKNTVVQYETEMKNGKHFLVAHGTPQEVELATAIFAGHERQT